MDRGSDAAWIERADGSELPVTEECRIGRIAGNDIVNADSRTSRRHAVVQRQGRRFILVDLGSTNGTFLNDARIFKPSLLSDGDVITVGSGRYTFRQQLGAASAEGDPETHDERTMAAVGRPHCWMLIAVVPESESWSQTVRRSLDSSDASVRVLPNASLFAHWREGLCPPDEVRTLFLELAGAAIPSGGRLVLHYGQVRVGPAAGPGQESLLGADVTLTHQLGDVSDLGASAVVSGPAADSLELGPKVSPLSAEAVPEAMRRYPLFRVG